MSHVDDCARFIECLSAYFDGELEPELEREFMLHYSTCERARVLVHTFERTIVLHRRYGATALPPDMHRRLLDAIRACRGDDE